MALDNQSASKPARRRPPKDAVFCVGWRAYVNWPSPAGVTPRPVPAMNRDGASLESDLADGQEVEILSWRPRSREGVIYEIRRIDDGREWWIAATRLRRTSETSPFDTNPIPQPTNR